MFDSALMEEAFDNIDVPLFNISTLPKKRLIYQVYIGKSKLYDHCIKSVAAYCKKWNIDHIVQKHMILNIKPDPFTSGRNKAAWEKHNGLVIYEKENAFEYLKTYDQVAIIDSDVFIKKTAPNIFDDFTEQYDFGAVIESDMPITDVYKKKIKNYSIMQYNSIKNVPMTVTNLGFEFMNMGVIVMNKSMLKYLNNETSKEFISRPEFKNFVDGVGNWKWSTDQTLLNVWIRSCGMNYKKMNWKWNGLFGVNTRLNSCHFVHFFLKSALPNNGENVQELMKYL